MHQWFPIKWISLQDHHSHLLPQSRGVNIQGDRGTYGAPTMTWWRSVLLSLAGRIWKTTPFQEDHSPSPQRRQLLSSVQTDEQHSLLSNTLPELDKVHVGLLGPKAPWTWSEIDSPQLGKMLPFRRIRQFLLEICENRWNKVHHFQSAMMHQSKPWKHQDFLPPKKAKTVMSAGKVITCSTTLKKSRTITRAGANYTEPISRDKKNALPLGQCSSTYIVHPQWYMAAI